MPTPRAVVSTMFVTTLEPFVTVPKMVTSLEHGTVVVTIPV
jgi:hypothetical protein